MCKLILIKTNNQVHIYDFKLKKKYFLIFINIKKFIFINKY